MGEYTVRFNWPAEVRSGGPDEHALTASDTGQAAVQAAMLFAGQDIDGRSPEGYRVFLDGAEVHRFPAL